MPGADRAADVALLAAAARDALAIGERHFGTATRSWTKDGGSPVSDADIAIDGFLKDRLLAARPDHGWLSEETADDAARLARRRVFVVDPIDGTRAFLAGERDWCVSIAIVEDGVPVVGALAGPSLEGVLLAARGAGAWLGETRVAARPSGRPLEIAGPKKGFPRPYPADATLVPRVPSLALRLARVGLGLIDAAFASTDAHDWDIAAANLIVTEAGGRLTGIDGARPIYNRAIPRHPPLVAAGAELHRSLMAGFAARQAG